MVDWILSIEIALIEWFKIYTTNTNNNKYFYTFNNWTRQLTFLWNRFNFKSSRLMFRAINMPSPSPPPFIHHPDLSFHVICFILQCYMLKALWQNWVGWVNILPLEAIKSFKYMDHTKILFKLFRTHVRFNRFISSIQRKSFAIFLFAIFPFEQETTTTTKHTKFHVFGCSKINDKDYFIHNGMFKMV